MTEVIIARESWHPFWPEAAVLAIAHTAEADAAMPERRYEVDDELITKLEAAGMFVLITARSARGTLLGYQTWGLAPDIQSRGTLTGQQWAWYICPEAPASLASAMWDFAKRELRSLGVHYLLSGVPASGRGTRLAGFYKRKGCRQVATQYYLWIGES